jgi:MSHA pilin protein MshC
LREKKEPRGSFFYAGGFSLLELVAVLLIVGILSIVAIARMSGGFATTRGVFDQLLAQAQYARKVAIAQRRPVFVRVGATQARLCYSAAGACSGGDGVASPNGEVPFKVDIPAGTAVSAMTFQFDALGRTRDAAGALTTAPLVLTVTGDGSLQFTIEHDTGYVRS